MKSRVDKFKLLSIWEDRWGKLSGKWSNDFLNDKRIKKILEFPAILIFSAVQKHKKIDEILNYLSKTSKQIKSKDNLQENIVNKSLKRKQQSLGTSAEINAIYEWLSIMAVAKLDPESTFSRLIIKSNKETCEGKRKYKSEIEAIKALIRMEKIKGNLVKQIPYKCNICREFHNTHLISRDAIKKLLRKYTPPKNS